MPFQQFHSSHTEQTIATMSQRIRQSNLENKPQQSDEQSDILDFNEAIVQPSQLFIDRVMRPHTDTLLHQCIENFLKAEWDYARRKMDDSFVNEVDPYLKSFNIDFMFRKNFTGNLEEYNRYLYQQVLTVIPSEANEAFQSLFANRILMREFSLTVSKIVQENNIAISRCYWPSWLKKALLHREKGCCALCGCDLTNLISINKESQIDHIIPISMGGANDPTNLQLICADCNKIKSSKNNQTSQSRHVFW